jgi:hypothetical protein
MAARSSRWRSTSAQRPIARWRPAGCVLGAVLALLGAGCTPIPQCHAIVNGVHYDADHTGPAWCEQLEAAPHLFNVQLFTGERHQRPPACDAFACLDNDDDAIRVSLNRALAEQSIGPGGAGVWLDIGAQSCHNFRGTLTVQSPPPQWALAIEATCADRSMSLDARLEGAL